MGEKGKLDKYSDKKFISILNKGSLSKIGAIQYVMKIASCSSRNSVYEQLKKRSIKKIEKWEVVKEK